jgi:hypothetical protein
LNRAVKQVYFLEKVWYTYILLQLVILDPRLLKNSGAIVMLEELSLLPRAIVAALPWNDDIIAEGYRLVRPTQATACVLGFSQKRIHRVGLAALLHDLGKLAIPRAILHKPGPLTSGEWAIMRRHSEIGCQMLLRAGREWTCIASIVCAHHERWDGLGYPYGLVEKRIPLEARILSVVDAYDAMTSLRVYQKPLAPAEARAELQRCAGHQFDPQVVAAFLQVLDKQGELPGEELSCDAYVDRHPASSLKTMAEGSAFEYVRTGRPYEV